MWQRIYTNSIYFYTVLLIYYYGVSVRFTVFSDNFSPRQFLVAFCTKYKEEVHSIFRGDPFFDTQNKWLFFYFYTNPRRMPILNKGDSAGFYYHRWLFRSSPCGGCRWQAPCLSGQGIAIDKLNVLKALSTPCPPPDICTVSIFFAVASNAAKVSIFE